MVDPSISDTVFIVKDPDAWDDVEYAIPADSKLSREIQEAIENQRLYTRIPASSLQAPEHLGRMVRYNEDTEGVLEAIEHEHKATHITVSGKKLITTDQYETIVLLPII